MTKVLVVEDNETNRYLLEALLSGPAYAVTSVNNGAAALVEARRQHPDVVISDILMPVMDGFALCKEWRAATDLRDIPFLFYTATYTDPKDEEFALSLGADAFLIKPQEPEVFVAKLQELLQRHAEGKLTRQTASMVTDEVFLKEYNQSLVRKLEDKLVQIEEANKKLLAELYARHQAEREVRRLNAELENRVELRTRELEAANRDLESFSYSVSHDLRTPLRHITGFVVMVAEDPDSVFSTRARQNLDVIKESAERMEQLIEGLLSLAQNDTMALRPRRVAVNSLIEEIRKLMAPAVEGRQVQWRVDPLPDAVADESLLRQVWINLVDNALKYSRNQIEAIVEIGGRADEEKNEVEYFIRDNGVGFDMEYSRRLFGVFQRLHNESQFEGVGVGLANVRRIIERHGGRIWAESKPRVGTTFFFRLPRDKALSAPGTEEVRGI